MTVIIILSAMYSSQSKDGVVRQAHHDCGSTALYSTLSPWFDRLTMTLMIILSMSKDVAVVRQAHHDWLRPWVWIGNCAGQDGVSIELALKIVLIVEVCILEPTNFRALVVCEAGPGEYVRRVEKRTLDDLPPGDVLVRVHYSSINYKDALSASGNRGVTRHYPHVPGIDAAGVVEASSASDYKPGDAVMIHDAEFGANAPGGFSEYARVPAAWLSRLPSNLTLRQSMAIGTAGLTAALCALRLQEQGVAPGDGEVLVTGATGGVGIFAVGLLARQGYHVVASTGKLSAHEMLTALGACAIVDRASNDDTSGKALLRAHWAGVVDTVGGNILSTVIRSTRYGGTVVCCGNVAGADLALTVYPFILRGVRLVGIDIANCPPDLRRRLWDDYASLWPLDQLDRLVQTCKLDELDAEIDRTLRGQRTGRVVVDLT